MQGFYSAPFTTACVQMTQKNLFSRSITTRLSVNPFYVAIGSDFQNKPVSNPTQWSSDVFSLVQIHHSTARVCYVCFLGLTSISFKPQHLMKYYLIYCKGKLNTNTVAT